MHACTRDQNPAADAPPLVRRSLELPAHSPEAPRAVASPDAAATAAAAAAAASSSGSSSPASSSAGAYDPAELTKGQPSRHLWLGNLHQRLPRSVLRGVFERFGPVEDVVTFPGRMYAFVNFKEPGDAAKAAETVQVRAAMQHA